jgi:hypothetical protein
MIRRAARGALPLFMLGVALGAASDAAQAADSVIQFANPMEAASEAPKVSLALRYFIGNDPLSVQAYQADWRGDYHPRTGMNLGLISARTDLAVQMRGWRLGYFRRLELQVEASRDTTDLVRLYKTRATASDGQNFAVNAQYHGFDAAGWRIDKALNWKTAGGDEIAVGAGYSLLEGRRVRTGSAQGSVSVLGAGRYGYAVSTDDADSLKDYPFQTPGQSGGHGRSIDLGLSWQTPQGYRLEWIANDLLARMRWHDIPGTVSNARSGVTTTDAEGYIVYAPALAGRNARRDFVQTLPARRVFAVEAPWRDLMLRASLTQSAGNSYPLIGAVWHFGGNRRLLLDYDLRFRTIGFKLANEFAFLGVRLSQRDVADPQAYGVSAGFSMSF